LARLDPWYPGATKPFASAPSFSVKARDGQVANITSNYSGVRKKTHGCPGFEPRDCPGSG
jgi:hypothetical protein